MIRHDRHGLGNINPSDQRFSRAETVRLGCGVQTVVVSWSTRKDDPDRN
jgi:hypothetical protein